MPAPAYCRVLRAAPLDLAISVVTLRQVVLVNTNMREAMRAKELIAFCCKRGAFESIIREFKAPKEPKLSARRRFC